MLFKAMPMEALQSICMEMKRLTYTEGARVITEGEHGDFYFVLVQATAAPIPPPPPPPHTSYSTLLPHQGVCDALIRERTPDIFERGSLASMLDVSPTQTERVVCSYSFNEVCA